MAERPDALMKHAHHFPGDGGFPVSRGSGPDVEKQKKADEAFDDIRRRFGNGMIVRGSTMSTAGKVARKAKAQMDQDVRTKKEKEK